MSSADTIVKRALNMIGAHTEINQADPEILTIGLQKLVALLEEHAGERIYYGAKLASLTSAATTATGTKTAHGWTAVGRTLIVAGAAEDAYNGRFAVASIPSADTFTYALAEAADTPATAEDEGRGITVLVIPGALAEPLNEQGGATEALMAMLAVRMGPTCRKSVSADVKGEALRGRALIKQLYQVPDIPNITPSRLLPRGQGASRGVLPVNFFRGEALDDDSAS